MAKQDYLDDPHAPEPNSLVVAVAAFIRNPAGDVLLIQRGDNGLWALPGGAQDIGETTTHAAIREVQEETGLRVRITGLVGIYSNPRHVIAYDNGEVRQEFSICFSAAPVGGDLRTSNESVNIAWMTSPELAKVEIHPSMRLRIEHGLEDRTTPHFD